MVEKLKFRSVAEVKVSFVICHANSTNNNCLGQLQQFWDNYNNKKGYELSLRKSLLMSTSDRPCSRAEENNVDECVRNFLERRIGCRLPYVPRGQEDEVCAWARSTLAIFPDLSQLSKFECTKIGCFRSLS